MKKIFDLITSGIFSLIINAKLFPLSTAIKMPILIKFRTKINVRRGSVVLGDQNIVKFGMIKLGLGGSDGIVSSGKSYFIVENGGKIVFKGKATFSSGTGIRVDGGNLTIGNNFWMNKNGTLFVSRNTEIGANFLAGWGVTIMDSNGHNIDSGTSNKKKVPQKGIIIGDHAWLAANVHILSGVEIGNDDVVGYGSIVTSGLTKQLSNSLIVGNPAKAIKKIKEWSI